MSRTFKQASLHEISLHLLTPVERASMRRIFPLLVAVGLPLCTLSIPTHAQNKKGDNKNEK